MSFYLWEPVPYLTYQIPYLQQIVVALICRATFIRLLALYNVLLQNPRIHLSYFLQAGILIECKCHSHANPFLFTSVLN